MLSALFASTGMTILSIAVLVLELLSLALVYIGLLSYRHIVVSHRTFFSSFQNSRKRPERVPFGILFWLYLLSTFFLVLLTIAIYIRLVRLF